MHGCSSWIRQMVNNEHTCICTCPWSNGASTAKVYSFLFPPRLLSKSDEFRQATLHRWVGTGKWNGRELVPRAMDDYYFLLHSINQSIIIMPESFPHLEVFIQPSLGSVAVGQRPLPPPSHRLFECSPAVQSMSIPRSYDEVTFH